MRFWLAFISLSILPIGLAAGLSAQSDDQQQSALRSAKKKAAAAALRSEEMRQEAANASLAVDRLVAQRAVLSAEIASAEAQIEAAKARIAIINSRQQQQYSMLGEASEPMLRLNSALQKMTRRPVALLISGEGQREDYVHLRAVMATVEPQISRRTASLRQQISIQKELRAQELLALKSLNDARGKLSQQRSALAQLEAGSRGQANSLAANAAIEFEQAIAQGEQARDIVENIDTQRGIGEQASFLAGLEGPIMRSDAPRAVTPPQNQVYLLPKQGRLVFGFKELNATGYRERGIKIAVSPGADVGAPAAGKISFAGDYRSFGKIVIIEHGSGWTTLITNLSALSVSEGRRVGQGQVVGSADSEVPEITMELRRNGRVMDIIALLN
jgi:murein hydrolase activator